MKLSHFRSLILTLVVAGSFWISGCAPASRSTERGGNVDVRLSIGSQKEFIEWRTPRPESKTPVEPASETPDEAKRRLDFEREKLAFERERLEAERKRVQEDAQRQKDQTTFLLTVIGGVVAVIVAIVGIALKVARREKA